MICLFHFSHFLLQRKPLDEGYDFVGLGFRALTCIFFIIVLSVAKQSQLLGTWLTKEEQLVILKAHWTAPVFANLKTIAFACLLAYILLH